MYQMYRGPLRPLRRRVVDDTRRAVVWVRSGLMVDGRGLMALPGADL
jgi:hypothetical protein